MLERGVDAGVENVRVKQWSSGISLMHWLFTDYCGRSWNGPTMTSRYESYTVRTNRCLRPGSRRSGKGKTRETARRTQRFGAPNVSTPDVYENLRAADRSHMLSRTSAQTGTTEIDEVRILWTSEGMSCGGDTVSVTAASLPSIEDVVLQAVPGIP